MYGEPAGQLILAPLSHMSNITDKASIVAVGLGHRAVGYDNFECCVGPTRLAIDELELVPTACPPSGACVASWRNGTTGDNDISIMELSHIARSDVEAPPQSTPTQWGTRPAHSS